MNGYQKRIESEDETDPIIRLSDKETKKILKEKGLSDREIAIEMNPKASTLITLDENESLEDDEEEE